MIKWLASLFLLATLITGASAQGSKVNLQCLTGNPSFPWDNCSAQYPLPVSATVSASITGFPTTQTTGTPISVTTGGVTGTLPTGAVVVASNVGATNNAYCKLGGSATTGDQLIPPNSWFAFTVGAATQLTCITSTSTTTVNMVGGSGLPTGSGGGSGGGGGGGGNVNVTQWDTTALGVPTAYGSAPTTGNYIGVNAYVTNTVPVTLTSTAITGTVAVSGPTAVGSANANPPVVMGGTTTGAAGQNVVGAAIKLASTAALATDTSIVVQESPNSALITAINTLNTTAGSSIAAGSNLIGSVSLNISAASVSATNGIFVAPTTAAQWTVIGPTAHGTAASTNPVLTAGTVDGTGTGAVAIPKYSAAGVGSHFLVDSGGTNIATIKAASTPAVSTDTALVVDQRPGTTISVSQTPATSGGLTPSSVIIASGNQATNTKASAGQVYKIECNNGSSTAFWVKFYNSASAPTPGSGTPVKRLLCPGNTAGVIVLASYDAGLAFGTGIAWDVTALLADADTTAPTSNVSAVNVDYK